MGHRNGGGIARSVQQRTLFGSDNANSLTRRFGTEQRLQFGSVLRKRINFCFIYNKISLVLILSFYPSRISASHYLFSVNGDEDGISCQVCSFGRVISLPSVRLVSFIL